MLCDLIFYVNIFVFIYLHVLDCIGIGIHAFHMHWNILGLQELVHEMSLEKKMVRRVV